MLVVEDVKTCAVTKEFIKAGHAVFTVEVPDAFVQHNGTKPHYTYKVVHKEADASWPEAWFVYLLTGPDNENDYTYLGKMHGDSGKLYFTAKSPTRDPNDWRILIFNRVTNRLWLRLAKLIIDAGWGLHHEGQCGRCGKTLTTPISVERGFGPDCWQQMNDF